LFLDEPTASLDPKIRKNIVNLLLKIHKKKSFTVLYTSHNLNEVKRFCTHIGFLKKGKLVSIKNQFFQNKNLLKMY